ncbi:HD domain-containing protein [Thermosporothrix hazakensis]|uniref:HD domain-containing protein n=1 Tax=Thermosporothrix hazakensis TaxID=644383 RepID=A0A326U7C5_THEHA|nr:HD domain-containing protein [Thermosporothrix hazakensis]PZW28447.1 HD domain-containing protein [Thermosporothrix hazakensis]GCE45226.1 phosphohydrolase [Thermosporothrix hazakensis]
MQIQHLPESIQAILAKHAAPPRLVAHLTIVHDVAVRLTARLQHHWPHLTYDRQAVLIGAATHDIGKAIVREELTGPGSRHEEIGPQLLRESGLRESYARFARTHNQWAQESPLEDLLVAFADTIWKGKRNIELEEALVKRIASQCQQEVWSVYMQFDEIAEELAQDAHHRLLWQGTYAP